MSENKDKNRNNDDENKDKNENKNENKDEEMFKVVYNSCYGGFGLSKDAMCEYNRRMSTNLEYVEGIDRSNPLLIDLVETMGKAVNDKYCKLKIKEFKLKYKGFIDWDEHDGKEYVYVNYNRYLIYNIRHVTKDTSMSSYEKINSIQSILDDYDSRPKTFMDNVYESEEKNI